MTLKEELYAKFPEFKATSNHFSDESQYGVFGNFGLYLYDMLNLKEEGKVREEIKRYHTEEPIAWHTVDINELIKRSYTFIDELYLRNDLQINDIIFTTIFWALADSVYSDKYAKKYFSKRTLKKYNEIIFDLNT